MNKNDIINIINEAVASGLKGNSYFIINTEDENNTENENKKEDNTEDENEQKEKEDIDEVVEATSFSSEEVHGGNEATGDIEDSPNSKEDGKSSKDKLDTNITSEQKRDTENKEGNTNIDNNESTKDEETNGEDESDSSNINIGMPIVGMSAMECLDSIKNAKDLSDPLYEAFLDVIKNIPSNNHIFGKQKYDIRKICNHMITYQEYKIPKDSYAKEVKTISIFVDTSGSMYYWGPSIKKAIKMIITAGYKVDLYACGNGFEYGDSLHDDQYHTRKQLREISPDANIPYIACPNEEDAIMICNASEVSIIVADFDGLSSIVRVAMGTSKIPYLFSIEDRYSWNDPTEHDWVDPDFCEYPDWNHVFNIVEYDDSDYDDDYYYDDDDYYDEK